MKEWIARRSLVNLELRRSCCLQDTNSPATLLGVLAAAREAGAAFTSVVGVRPTGWTHTNARKGKGGGGAAGDKAGGVQSSIATIPAAAAAATATAGRAGGGGGEGQRRELCRRRQQRVRRQPRGD